MKTKNAHPSFSRQAGLTLVEIMIALLLGLFLTIGIISIVVSTQQTYRVNDSLSRIQENGRFAMEIFGVRLRSAAYTGCFRGGAASSGFENILNNANNFAWDLSIPVQGFNNVAANAIINGIATNSIAGTDILVVREMSEAVPLAANPDTSTFTVASSNNRFDIGQILLVSDCDQLALFQATSVDTAGVVTTILHASGGGFSPGNTTSSITSRFSADAQIGKLQTYIFDIETAANGRPALFERRLVTTGGNSVIVQTNELIPNVENLQLSFGVDTNSDKNTDAYQAADVVANWQNVLSVRVALLLSSEQDNQLANAESYSFNAATFTYDKDNPVIVANADRRIRRIYSGYVALRNRIML